MIRSRVGSDKARNDFKMADMMVNEKTWLIFDRTDAGRIALKRLAGFPPSRVLRARFQIVSSLSELP